MGRWSQWIPENRRNTRKNKVLSYEQQQLDVGSKKIQRVERQWRKLLKDMVAIFWAEKLKLFLERFDPNHSPQGVSCLRYMLLCSDLRYISWGRASPRCTSSSRKSRAPTSERRAWWRIPDSESINNTDRPWRSSSTRPGCWTSWSWRSLPISTIPGAWQWRTQSPLRYITCCDRSRPKGDSTWNWEKRRSW